MIKFIFVVSEETSELAHVSSHCVTGLTLPPVDANILDAFFIARLRLVWACEEESFLLPSPESPWTCSPPVPRVPWEEQYKVGLG